MLALLNPNEYSPVVHVVGDVDGVRRAVHLMIQEYRSSLFMGIQVFRPEGLAGTPFSYVPPKQMVYSLRMARSELILCLVVDPAGEMTEQVKEFVQMTVNMESETGGEISLCSYASVYRLSGNILVR